MVGWALSVHVDPDVLEVLGAQEGPFLSAVAASWNLTTDFKAGSINKTGGYLRDTSCQIYGWQNIPDGQGGNGTGMLCKYGFKSQRQTTH